MAHLGSKPELLEPGGKPVAIGVVLAPPRRPHRRTCDRLETLLKQWSVMQDQQPLGDVDTPAAPDIPSREFKLKPLRFA